MHNGVDLKAYFEPLFAIMDGIVAGVGRNSVSGNLIKLLHHKGLRSSYSHLSELRVKVGRIFLRVSTLASREIQAEARDRICISESIDDCMNRDANSNRNLMENSLSRLN